jgi:hypothetical protein
MYGAKPVEDETIPRKTYPAWFWTNPTYTIETTKRLMDVRVFEVDASQRMADVDRKNNRLELKY